LGNELSIKSIMVQQEIAFI